ncbi:MFS transporter [Eikenella longinqua]|uniref:MFS transporter n=1 Tax=Eikenella longinqua TaxID=1795827 RepID=A0A1A9RYD0_9NEIS|nr:MFS transporter [Eikenella longinqua]
MGTLFQVELWERFSFYSMQAILVIYLYYQAEKGGLAMPEALAVGIVGAYNGSIYLSTIIGGWFADRVIGPKNTLFLAVSTMLVGHILLVMIPGVGSLAGLPFIALGSGGVKSACSTLVGSLYEDESTRNLRDAGFSIFYTGINIGSFCGSLVAGYLQTHMGFRMAFAGAVVGIAIGLTLFVKGKSKLPDLPLPNPLPKEQRGKAIGMAVGILVVIGGLIATKILRLDNFSSILLGVVTCISIGYFFLMFHDKEATEADRRHIIAYVPLFIVMCLFWAICSQVYSSVTLYFDKTVNRTFGGFTVPVAWLVTYQSLIVISLAGVMAAVWTKMGTRQPKSQMKFTLAMLFLGLAYLGFVPFLSSGTPMPIIVLMLLLVITIAELLLSPISLSFATKVAPKAFKTQMVAFNFLTLSLGFTLGGVLGDKLYSEEAATQYFMILAGLSIGSFVALLLLMPKLNKLLHDVD